MGVRPVCNAASWTDWYCAGIGTPATCSCKRSPHPLLHLRGLCPTSNIDSIYIPVNDRQDITKLLYKGSYDTVMEYNDEEEVWKMKVSYTNTTGKSESSLVSYVLGKHDWTIEMDKGCNKGKPYSRQLKLTICK